MAVDQGCHLDGEHAQMVITTAQTDDQVAAVSWSSTSGRSAA